jgi:PadR family transcriptional regulator, regulatory protein PadR
MTDAVGSLGVVKGTLDVLVLKTLAWDSMHGFEIVTWLEERSTRGLDVDDAATYQALRRLETRGFVRAQLGLTENNRRARYYHLTPAGREHLRSEIARWNRYTALVDGILSLPVPRKARAWAHR